MIPSTICVNRIYNYLTIDNNGKILTKEAKKPFFIEAGIDINFIEYDDNRTLIMYRRPVETLHQDYLNYCHHCKDDDSYMREDVYVQESFYIAETKEQIDLLLSTYKNIVEEEERIKEARITKRKEFDAKQGKFERSEISDEQIENILINGIKYVNGIKNDRTQ